MTSSWQAAQQHVELRSWRTTIAAATQRSGDDQARPALIHPQ
ncbi:hypothetical protein ACFQY7_05450 [Actinomadura luteofluorescens]